jgi:EmrB/QacA subfamily drug resistance transporter
MSTPSSSSAPVPGRPPAARAGWALAGLSLAILLAQLGATVANVGLPTLMQVFHQSFAVVQWVVVGYLLAVTALIVSVGRLADLWGRKRVFLGGIMVFTAASALCAAAPGVWWLIVARALQGLGAAVMLALTMAFAGDVVPRERAGAAMGLLSTMQSVATTLAPSLGGFAIAWLGWRAMFWLNVPIGLVALWVARRYLPDTPPPAARSGFDVGGTVLLVSALVAYSLAMTQGQGAGFGAPSTIALLAGAAAGLALFVAWERRARAPLVRPGAFRSLPFSVSMVTNVLIATVMMSTLTLGPFYLSGALKLSAAEIGLVMSIGPLAAAFMGVPSGRVADRFGARPTLVAGLALLALGCLGLAWAAPQRSVVAYVGAIALVCIGYAFFQTPNNTAVMAEAPADGRATTSALLNLTRNLGLVSGASVMGSLFAAVSGLSVRSAEPAADPAVIAHGMQVSFLVASALVAISLALAVLTLRQGRRAPLVASRGHGA